MDNDANPMQARFAIRELLDEYSNLVNRRAWVRLGDVFSADAIFETHGTPTPRLASGREAVVAEISKAVDSFEMLIQVPYAPLIDRLDDDEAEVVSFLTETVSANPERGFILSGACHDRIVREGGRWRIAHRRFVARYLHVAPLPGKILG